MFRRRENQATAVPVGVAGGTANNPAMAGQGVGYGDQVGSDVNSKAGYAYDQNGNVLPQQTTGTGYRGRRNVQQTPVSYGPDGQPLPVKDRNKPANCCAAFFVACWACTWPCHAPCCCGL